MTGSHWSGVSVIGPLCSIQPTSKAFSLTGVGWWLIRTVSGLSLFNGSKIYPKISHRNVVIIVSRLVKGRLSDTTKTVRVPVPGGADNITLVLDCEDKLPYRVQVNALLRKSD